MTSYLVVKGANLVRLTWVPRYHQGSASPTDNNLATLLVVVGWRSHNDSSKLKFLHHLKPEPSLIFQYFPFPGLRSLPLLPQDSAHSDRIPEQLMFVPPADTTLPDNPEDPSAPLKKILLWNGVSSWGNTRPGRGFFIKEKCPVSTCAITSSRSELRGSVDKTKLFGRQFTGIRYSEGYRIFAANFLEAHEAWSF